MEILRSLRQRLEQVMSMQDLTHADLDSLYQSGQCLTRLEAVLQHRELWHLSQFGALHTRVLYVVFSLEHGDSMRTERSNNVMRTGDSPVDKVSVAADDALPEGLRIQAKPDTDAVAEHPWAIRPWVSFTAGMFTMLAIFSIVGSGWQYINAPDPLQLLFSASLSPLPDVLSPAPAVPSSVDVSRQYRAAD